MNTAYRYEGDELDLFGQALRWKAYWAAVLAPHLGDRVLDVGAGLGATALAYARRDFVRWLALEPDPTLANRLTHAVASGGLPARTEVQCGTLADVPATANFDTILYIDVLEHIEDDAGELALAAQHLDPGGRIVVLAPAHGWLYSPFDRAVGHHRRYDRAGLARIRPAGLSMLASRYLDSAGLLASLGNRLLLRQANPTRAQIAFWDRCLVPVSRLLDPLTGGRLGKSVVAVYGR